MELNGKKILVIGGAGLIGSHTVDQLIEHDVAKITIFDNFARGKITNLEAAMRDPRVSLYEAGGDISQSDILDEAISGADAVFQFAALWLLQCHEFPKAAFQVNVEGMFNILQSCVKHDVERLVWSSSASVYGDAETEPMAENHPFNNKNFYGATKIAGEAMATAFSYRYGLEQVGLRYMNVYGPRQDYKGAYIAVIMKMLDAIASGKNPTILGDGSEAFDFVHVRDCAAANIKAMQAATSAEYYNVGTGSRTSLLELAQLLLEVTGSKSEIEFKERSQATLVKNRIGCPLKAIDELGFKAEIALKDGLSEVAAWHKTQIASNH